MSDVHQIVLASQSRQRQELFASLGIPFLTKPADIDELAIDHPDHARRAALVAVAKAKTIRQMYPKAIIIAADTFVVFQDQRLEKPLTKVEAVQMLSRLSDQTFQAYTGWTYSDPHREVAADGCAVTSVSFRQLSEAEIRRYVEQNPVTSWAGGFSIVNSAGLSLIRSVTGSLTGLMGLPIEELLPLLDQSLLR